LSGGSGAHPYHQADPPTKSNNNSKKKSKQKKKISPEEVCRLFFKDGLSQTQIAKKLGVKPKEISNIFRKLGLEAHKYSQRDLQIGKLYYVDRMTKADIARKLGVSYNTVVRTFDKYGWKSLPRPKRANPEDARRLYEKGLTQREIAEILGVSYFTIGNYLRELGVPIRKRGYKTDKEREEARKNKLQRHRDKVKDLRDKLFGSNCRICGVGRDKRKLAIHRKDCQEHDEKDLWRLKALRKMTPEEWAALCVMCHRGAHWAHDDMGWDFNKLEKMAKQKEESEKREKEAQKSQDEKPTPKKDKSKVDATDKDVDELRKALFGEDCYFCGPIPSDKALAIHRKDGEDHDKRDLWDNKKLQGLDPDEWVPLCQRHHRYAHWAMNRLNRTWQDLASAMGKISN